MARFFSLVFILLLTAFGTAAYADPPGRVARLNHAAGPVSFAPADAPDAWSQAVLNRPLTSGDRIWVDQTGRAELHVGSMAIRLAELTSLDVLNLDDQAAQLRLSQGALNLRVRDLAPGEIIEIATPTGAVILRQPGSYRVSSDPQGEVSRVRVHFGQAEVVTPTQAVAVPSGQSAVIAAGSGIAFEIAAYAASDEFDRWSAERDRREDNVVSTRYVSREMTGYEELDQHGSWRTLPEYGAVWVPARVAPGWAPYRHGHWSWISPWGWTWIDDAPWGFAPSHYGRWVWADSYWAWAPGARERRPVYAPALVAFIGGSDFHVSISSGPAVGWFPLGWREPYRPWYRASPVYVRNVNVTHVTHIYHDRDEPRRHLHRDRRDAVTFVPRQAFVSARPVAQSRFNVSPAELSRAEVLRDRQPAEPTASSLGRERDGRRPPAQALSREVVAIHPVPAPAARERPGFREGASFTRAEDNEPRVRVLRRERERDDERRSVAPEARFPRAQQTPNTRREPAPPAAESARPTGGAALSGAAPAVTAPIAPTQRAAPAAPAAPPAPSTASPGRPADATERGPRREPGFRNEAQREAFRERRERVPESMPRESREPRARSAPFTSEGVAPGRAQPPAPAEAAPRSAPPRPQQVPRQEERPRGGRGDPPAAREGAPQRPPRAPS